LRGAGPTRHGAALVVALICLLLVGVLAATLARSAVLQHDQVLQEQWQIQAESLAASALDRAAVQLAIDPDYSGETWLPASAGSAPIGRVLIELVANDQEQPEYRTIRVVADVPDAPQRRARVTRAAFISPSNSVASTPN
jgi:Tfp pilus assembly protein PilX